MSVPPDTAHPRLFVKRGVSAGARLALDRVGRAQHIARPAGGDQMCSQRQTSTAKVVHDEAQAEGELIQLRQSPLAELVGSSAVMQRLRADIRRVAASDFPVLVTGPTGSGKELAVRAIHGLGGHPEAPFLDLNCSAISPALVESQLFGHRRGAFTGALDDHCGYFAGVGVGTLFLDEIAELELALQSKLLRALEQRTFRPVGSLVEQEMKGRIVAATHMNLVSLVDRGLFRRDLFHRLEVLSLRVPSLDERREDIPELIEHFQSRRASRLIFDAGAIDLLIHRNWPGNIRELRNVIDRMIVFVDREQVRADDVKRIVADTEKGAESPAARLEDLASALLKIPVEHKLEAVEEALIRQALIATDGNKTKAARMLGVHRKVLERRLRDKSNSNDFAPACES